MARMWQVEDAEAKFSEFLAASISDGPQIVAKRGMETAVLIPIEQWRRLQKVAKPDLKELLLTPEARTNALTPARSNHYAPAPRNTGCTHALPPPDDTTVART